MVIKVGTGTPYSVTFSASAKTLTFSGFYNADLSINNIVSIYNTTRSAYMLGGGATARAVDLTESMATGLPVYTLTLSAVPASSANGDALIILVNIPDNVALQNAIDQIMINTTPTP